MQSLAFPVLEIVAVVAFALSGISVAKTSGLDIVGTYFCAMLTALGGGTVRDVLINHRPFYWVEHEWLLLLILALVAGSYTPALQRLYGPWSTLTRAADAIGTGIFALSGLVLALHSGFGPMASVLMSIITAIMGGALRDITCGQIPHVFKRTELVATCALTGCLIYFALNLLTVPFELCFIVSAASAAVFRYLALVKGLRLPW